jgi:hypothetical protein
MGLSSRNGWRLSISFASHPGKLAAAMIASNCQLDLF